MLRERLKIPKRLKQVTLWVHPEGRVVGFLFLRPQSANRPGAEEPAEVLNTADPFLVLKRDDPEELRFYNKTSVVRVEYADDEAESLPSVEPLSCTLHLMDGSMIAGTIRKALPRIALACSTISTSRTSGSSRSTPPTAASAW